MKQFNAKRKGSAFPKVRDAKYRRWVWTENPCVLAGRTMLAPLGSYDKKMRVPQWGYGQDMVWRHICWGVITPAHVGEHQAQGAPDFGVLVPLCKAAHQFYDEHRDEWAKATGFTEKKMALRASGYAVKYVEGGGVPPERETPA